MKKITIKYLSSATNKIVTRIFLAEDVTILPADDHGVRTRFVFTQGSDPRFTKAQGPTVASFECRSLESVEIAEEDGKIEITTYGESVPGKTHYVGE